MKDTEIIYTCGKRRSGKSGSVKLELGNKKRLLIWDAPKEYGRDLKNIIVVRDRRQLVRLLAANKRGPLRVAFEPPSLKHFDWFCRLAAVWGNCTVVVEELASVTTPAKAPAGWGDLVRLSAHYHVEIYAQTQRPAEADKTIFGNSTKVRCFKLVTVRDIKCMADEMRIDRADLDALPLYWCYERNTETDRLKLLRMPWAKPWPRGRNQAA